MCFLKFKRKILNFINFTLFLKKFFTNILIIALAPLSKIEINMLRLKFLKYKIFLLKLLLKNNVFFAKIVENLLCLSLILLINIVIFPIISRKVSRLLYKIKSPTTYNRLKSNWKLLLRDSLKLSSVKQYCKSYK